LSNDLPWEGVLTTSLKIAGEKRVQILPKKHHQSYFYLGPGGGGGGFDSHGEGGL